MEKIFNLSVIIRLHQPSLPEAKETFIVGVADDDVVEKLDA